MRAYVIVSAIAGILCLASTTLALPSVAIVAAANPTSTDQPLPAGLIF